MNARGGQARVVPGYESQLLKHSFFRHFSLISHRVYLPKILPGSWFHAETPGT
jgi:hypothetical protein